MIRRKRRTCTCVCKRVWRNITRWRSSRVFFRSGPCVVGRALRRRRAAVIRRKRRTCCLASGRTRSKPCTRTFEKAFARESGETSPVDAVVGLFPFWPMRRGTSAPRTASSRYDPQKAEGLLPRIGTEHAASHVHARSKKAFARESGETSPVGAVAGLFPFWPMRRGTSAPRTASSRYDPEKTQDLLPRIRTNTQQAGCTRTFEEGVCKRVWRNITR